jgi:ABC-type bacteriocin/lantibiotic exporter with double-glycine peptidase domain
MWQNMKTSNILDEDIKGFSERYIRWQTIRIEQFGYVNNLIIALASGSLLWQGQTLLATPTIVHEHLFYLLSAILFFVSVITGCYITWIRLGDYSLTADRLRSLMETPSATANQKTKDLRQEMKDESDRLGKITRNLLPIQFFTFGIGFGFVALDIIFNLYSK